MHSKYLTIYRQFLPGKKNLFQWLILQMTKKNSSLSPYIAIETGRLTQRSRWMEPASESSFKGNRWGHQAGVDVDWLTG